MFAAENIAVRRAIRQCEIQIVARPGAATRRAHDYLCISNGYTSNCSLDAAMRRLYGPRDFTEVRASFRTCFRAKLMGDTIDKDGAGKEEPPSLDEFSDRLDRMRGSPEPENPRGSGAAWGHAMRVSSELLAGLFVGCLLGLGLDRWLGTQPLFLLIGMGLGFAAGLRNLMRSANKGNGHSSEDG